MCVGYEEQIKVTTMGQTLLTKRLVKPSLDI